MKTPLVLLYYSRIAHFVGNDQTAKEKSNDADSPDSEEMFKRWELKYLCLIRWVYGEIM